MLLISGGARRMLVDMHSQLVQIPGSRYKNDEEALSILKSAAADGITHMIATPIYQNNNYMNKELAIENHIEKLNSKLIRLDIPVTVFEGMEIVLYEKIVQDIKLNLLPLAGSNKYVFIRFQSEEIPSFALNIFFEMQLMGYIPVIANVERNIELVSNMRKLRAFVERGALVHVGAASVLGTNGKRIQKKALKLCRSGLVHLISSASPDFKNGPSLLKPAYEYLERKLSLSAVEYFTRNAENVINGSDFHVKNPNHMGKSYFNQ